MNESFFKIGNLPDNFSLMQNCKKKNHALSIKLLFIKQKRTGIIIYIDFL